ncbi:helix-turn-helix transcriptional regulator [Candidatus Binatia bacterium]|nr:helix-turn-helix transcriptional regulator [Candidatus Binatia bacterium]
MKGPAVANRLRAALADRDWSQQDLSDLSGLPYATIRRLVRDGGNHPLDLALAVCGALGVDLEDVYRLESDAEGTTGGAVARRSGLAREPVERGKHRAKRRSG